MRIGQGSKKRGIAGKVPMHSESRDMEQEVEAGKEEQFLELEESE